MKETKGKKGLDNDHFFSRSTLDQFDGCRIITPHKRHGAHRAISTSHKIQRKSAKKINFLRSLGLLATTHKYIDIKIG